MLNSKRVQSFGAFVIFAITPIKIWAQEIDCFPLDGMEESRNYVSSSFQWENDIANSDRWYTNGMKYTRTKNPECNKDNKLDSRVRNLLDNDYKSIFLASWSIGMNMYTPTVITEPNIQPNDRPWTGWAYYGREWRLTEIKNDDSRYLPGNETKIEILVGALGKWAHQDKAQKTFHTLVGADMPEGWGNQKTGKLGVSFAFTRQWNSTANTQQCRHFNDTDINGRIGLTAGNVVNQFSVGGGFSYATDLFTMKDDSYLPIASFSGAKQITPAFMAEGQSKISCDDKQIACKKEFGTEICDKEYEICKREVAILEKNKLGAARRQWYEHSTYYVFGDVEGKYLLSSTFVNGTRVSMRPFVADVKVGIAHKNANSDLTWRISRLFRSPEFDFPNGGNPGWQRVWQGSLEWNWGWVKNPIHPE